jgi:hypothetical protein
MLRIGLGAIALLWAVLYYIFMSRYLSSSRSTEGSWSIALAKLLPVIAFVALGVALITLSITSY